MPHSFLKAPLCLEIKTPEFETSEILKSNINYVGLHLDEKLLIDLPPLSAQTPHQLQWKIAESLPCPMEDIAYCVDSIGSDLYQVRYLKKDWLQKLVSDLESHDCLIDSINVGMHPLEQINFKKPWVSWQNIHSHRDQLQKGFKVFLFLTLLLVGSSLILNPLEQEYRETKESLNHYQQQTPAHGNSQEKLITALQGMSSIPAQTKTQHIRFDTHQIEFKGESLKNQLPQLKNWLNSLGAKILYQESSASLNTRVQFTAAISL